MQFSFFPIAGICLTSLETSKEVRLSHPTFPPAAYESPWYSHPSQYAGLLECFFLAILVEVTLYCFSRYSSENCPSTSNVIFLFPFLFPCLKSTYHLHSVPCLMI